MAASIGAVLRRKGHISCQIGYQTVTSLTAKSQLDTNSSCGLHTSPCFQVDRRKDRAIAQHVRYRNLEHTLKHRNTSLVQLPDYSYLDGRPTEIPICQVWRHERNYEMAKQIVQLVGEMEKAQAIHASQQKGKATRERKRNESKLKPKGTPL